MSNSILDHGVSCLHIGMPKTATTTLQHFVYPFHSQVYYLGKFYPPLPFYLNRQIEEIIVEIQDRDPSAERLAELRSSYQKLTTPAFAAGKIPIWSDELAVRTSHADLKTRARRFRAICGDCKVLITIRHPVSFVKSLYLHMLTTYQIDRERWLERTKRAGYAQKPVFVTIDQWLEKIGFCPGNEAVFGVNNFIDIASIAEIFAEQFGPENIGIFPFEQMVEDLPTFVHEISKFLGIGEVETLKLVQGHRSAQRVSQETVERLRHICASPMHTTLFRFAPQGIRNWMTGLTTKNGSKPIRRADVAVPAPWVKRIEEVSRESNGRLLQNWSVPLESFGYPV